MEACGHGLFFETLAFEWTVKCYKKKVIMACLKAEN